MATAKNGISTTATSTPPSPAMNRDTFVRITGTTEWASISDLQAKLDDAGYWTDDFAAVALDQHKHAHIRRMIAEVKGPDGRRLFESVVRIDEETGTTHRVYKQTTLFEEGDYRQAVGYHLDRAWHHFDTARHLARRCKETVGVQLALDLPAFEDDGDEPGEPAP